MEEIRAQARAAASPEVVIATMAGVENWPLLNDAILLLEIRRGDAVLRRGPMRAGDRLRQYVRGRDRSLDSLEWEVVASDPGVAVEITGPRTDTTIRLEAVADGDGAIVTRTTRSPFAGFRDANAGALASLVGLSERHADGTVPVTVYAASGVVPVGGRDAGDPRPE